MSKNGEAGATLTRRSEEGVTRWSPWKEMAEMRRQMDDLYGRAFGYPLLPPLMVGRTPEFEPDVDIYETEDKFQVFLSLPGYAPKDINVEATNDAITIAGERKALYENDKATLHRRSGMTGTSRFSLRHTFPSEIDPNKIKAAFSNGVLTLELPKTERARVKSVKVDVKGA